MSKVTQLVEMKQKKRQLSKKLKKSGLSQDEMYLHQQLKFSIRILHNKLKEKQNG